MQQKMDTKVPFVGDLAGNKNGFNFKNCYKLNWFTTTNKMSKNNKNIIYGLFCCRVLTLWKLINVLIFFITEYIAYTYERTNAD